jgi:Uma2 family endonuclease
MRQMAEGEKQRKVNARALFGAELENLVRADDHHSQQSTRYHSRMSQIVERNTTRMLEQWQQVLTSSSFHDLPYKIETNERGQIIMSPVTLRHTLLQYRISEALKHHLPDGLALQEVSILTNDGVRVADVVWISPERLEESGADLLLQAPEICIEVWSQSNTAEEFEHKQRLYFQAGALEVWTCSQAGQMRFFAAQGELEGSSLVVGFPTQIEA